MIISIIVAIAQNNVIGNNNQLIWHIPGDLKRFKSITMGHTVVMGRKTFESIGKPLPGRKNVVISRQTNFKAEGCLVYNSLDKALDSLKNEGEIFIIGGGEIYRLAMPISHKIYLTKIHKDFPGDTFFPEIPMEDWEITHEELISDGVKADFSYSYIDLERKN
jgi:dihydrofolate reductase